MMIILQGTNFLKYLAFYLTNIKVPTVQKFVVCNNIFLVFLKDLLLRTKYPFIWSKHRINSNIVKYYNFK